MGMREITSKLHYFTHHFNQVFKMTILIRKIPNWAGVMDTIFSIQLDKNLIEEFGLMLETRLPKLYGLHLDENQLREIPVNCTILLGLWPKITSLTLNNNMFMSFPKLTCFDGLSNGYMRHFHLYANPFRCDLGIAWLLTSSFEGAWRRDSSEAIPDFPFKQRMVCHSPCHLRNEPFTQIGLFFLFTSSKKT